MRRFLFAPVLLTLALPVSAQDPAPPAWDPAPKDPASYIIGTNVAMTLKRQGVDLELESFLAGMKETLSGAEARYSAEEAQEIMDKLNSDMTAKAEKKGEQNVTDGKAFLDTNGKRDGVKTTASGLQYEVLEEGTGPKPAATDTVKVHYTGTLLDGSVFDSSKKRDEPFVTPLNRVIKGWTEGVQLMTVGSKYKFYIPSDLAYGPSPQGPGGPNSTLIFEVELLGIEGPQ